MESDYLFVYGTLMRGTHPMHTVLSEHAKFVSNGWITGQLYQIADYPGAIASQQSEDKVFGELYQFSDVQIIQLLDDYEECSAAFPKPHEYIRRRVNVYVTEMDISQAWTYFYNRSVASHQRLLSGRFTSV